jgi:hypothetical protein
MAEFLLEPDQGCLHFLYAVISFLAAKATLGDRLLVHNTLDIRINGLSFTNSSLKPEF